MWRCICGRTWPDTIEICWCGKRQLSPIQAYFLARLRHLVDYGKPAGDCCLSDRLVNRAIFSTRRDLEALGLGDEARRVVERQGEVP